MSKKAPCILVIDDDRATLKQLRDDLREDGYEIYTAESGEEALEKVVKYPIDLILLDILLPGDMSGLEVGMWVREQVPTYLPIIMLTVKNNENDLVQALTLFANDYITKPYRKLELKARILANLRNIRQTGTIFTAGQLKVDFLNQSVYVNNHEVQLQPKEYKILEILIINRGRLVTPDTLIYRLWGDEDNIEAQKDLHSYRKNEVHTLMSTLRKKIDPQRLLIQTHYQKGYRFKEKD